MAWITVEQAVEQGQQSRATVFRRIKADVIPSYVDPAGIRWVWSVSQPWEAVLAELAELREEIKGLRSQPETGSKSAPTPKSQRATRAQVTPAKQSQAETAWRHALDQLVRREGSITAAGRLLGVSQPTVSRWVSGRRTPREADRLRIVTAAKALACEAA